MGQDSYLGSTADFLGMYAPVGWLDCAGQRLRISDHPALYAVIGNHYGGDGVHEFALPDYRPVKDGRRVDWGEVHEPRRCVCVDGLYPVRE